MSSPAPSDVFAHYGVSEVDLLAEFRRSLGETPEPTTADLSEEQAAFLREHSSMKLPDDWGRQDAAKILASMLVDNAVEAVRSTVTVNDAASWLGVDPSRVRHRLSDGSLYGFKVGKQLRLPIWQFERPGGKRSPVPIPGLRVVLAALADGLHPLEVATFMTTPDTDLVVDDGEVSPRDWLISGGDPSPVADLAAVADSTW